MTKEEFESKLHSIENSGKQSSEMMRDFKSVFENFSSTVLKENEELKSKFSAIETQNKELEGKVEAQSKVIELFNNVKKEQLIKLAIENNKIAENDKEYFSKLCDEMGNEKFSEMLEKITPIHTELLERKITGGDNYSHGKYMKSVDGKTYNFKSEQDKKDFETMLNGFSADESYKYLGYAEKEGI